MKFPNITLQTTDFSPQTVEVTSADAFLDAFKAISEAHHQLMRANGFWDARDAVVRACEQYGGPELTEAAMNAVDAQLIALEHTELAEATEALRHGNPPDDKIPDFDSVTAELADVVIRIMDHAAGRKLRLAEAIIAKLQMNALRPRLHGKQF